jgi:hypothetical protein
VPDAVINKIRAATTPGRSISPELSAYNMLNAQSMPMAIAMTAALKPVSNIDIQGALKSVPNPSLDYETNKTLGNDAARKILAKMAEAKIKETWRAKFGSPLAVHPVTGATADSVFRDFMNGPKSAPVKKPFSQYLTESEVRKLRVAKNTSAKSSIISIETLDD